ncbi:hypothetical protein K8R66_03410, partial [bacterium]|nr:hypothetical protein [bacterium]
LIINSLTMAVIIYIVNNNDYIFYKAINTNIFKFILLSVPYFWITSLAAITAIIFYNFKNTKTGYRYTISQIVFTTIISSLLLGFIFQSIGLGNLMENRVNQHIPMYKKTLEQQINHWHHPEKGIIVGYIKAIDNNELILLDPSQNKWRVIIKNLETEQDVETIRERAKYRPIKIIGNELPNFMFEAKYIRPLIGRFNFGRRQNNYNCNNDPECRGLKGPKIKK